MNRKEIVPFTESTQRCAATVSALALFCFPGDLRADIRAALSSPGAVAAMRLPLRWWNILKKTKLQRSSGGKVFLLPPTAEGPGPNPYAPMTLGCSGRRTGRRDALLSMGKLMMSRPRLVSRIEA